MAGLALLYLALALLSDSGRPIASWAIALLAAVFIIEFTIRLLDAPSRYAYLRAHWLDLVSSIPLVGGLRSLRFLRFLRLGAVVRLLAAAEHTAARRGARDGMWFVAPILLTVWFAGSAAYWTFERGVNPALHTFGDALYWAAITMTTVGYGDIKPLTSEGRVVAGLLVFVGIGLVGFASARLTSHWLKTGSDEVRVADRLASLEHEIARLADLVRSVAHHTADVPEHSTDPTIAHAAAFGVEHVAQPDAESGLG